MHRSALVSVTVGGAVSTVCLWYAFRGVRIAELWNGATHIGLEWILLSLLAAIVNLLIRAARWRLLLSSIAAVKFPTLASATFIGIMANNLLPARIGEIVRAWIVAHREGAPMPTVLGSVVVERLLDGLTTLLILGACAVLWTHPKAEVSRLLQQTGLVVAATAVIGLAGLIAVARYRNCILAFSTRLARLLGNRWSAGATELLNRFLRGLCVFSSGAQVAAVCGLSLAAWSILILSFHVLAVGFDLPVSLVQTAIVFVIVMFGIAMPSAPGFVGTFHGFCVAGLSLVADVDASTAAAYATVLHGSHWLVINLIGLGCLMRSRSITWSAVSRLARKH